MSKKEKALDKFRTGQDMSQEEICYLSMVDRCRYIVTKFFTKGFSAGEVHQKMHELSIDGGHTPMEIHGFLSEYYGAPS